MIRSRLRQFSRREMVLNRYIKHWRQQGIDLQCSELPADKRLIKFQTDTGWVGVIDPFIWLSHIEPDMAGLAHQAFQPSDILALFSMMPQPVTLPVPALSYQKVIVASWLNATDDGNTRWPLLTTPQGSLWLMQLDEQNHCTKPDAVKLNHLTVPLCFEVGESIFNVAGLKKLALGDVLLVSTPTRWVTSQGKKIGIYHLSEEHITVESYDPSSHPVGVDEKENSNENWHGDALQSHSTIPVKLTFVLDQQTLTLDECGQLLNGGVITCTPDAEKRVTLLANGSAIARGELLWIEERMGVEITSLYDGSGHGK